MTNLIYWMALHTELSITERWRHGFDVFPDEGRSQPFASGATCSYNYIDLQISNRTANTYQLRVWVEGDYLNGEWRADAEAALRIPRLWSATMPSGPNGGAVIAGTTRFTVLRATTVPGQNAAKNSSPRTTPS